LGDLFQGRNTIPDTLGDLFQARNTFPAFFLPACFMIADMVKKQHLFSLKKTVQFLKITSCILSLFFGLGTKKKYDYSLSRRLNCTAYAV